MYAYNSKVKLLVTFIFIGLKKNILKWKLNCYGYEEFVNEIWYHLFFLRTVLCKYI